MRKVAAPAPVYSGAQMAGTAGLISPATPACQTGLVGKIGIAISPARSSRVYAIIEADAGEGGIYRSDDGGSNWQMTHTDPWKLDSPKSYNHITADPLDPDVVYVQINAGLLKSTDAGRTFEHVPIKNWDSHALWIDPDEPRRYDRRRGWWSLGVPQRRRVLVEY